MADLLISGPSDADGVLMLGHGAGAGMESAFMVQMADLLAARRVRTVRFEFAYMAARRSGKRRPPPRGELLVPEYRAAVAQVRELERPRRLVIGGKSLGGRVASLLADELYAEGAIRGLVCLGYPFHPPKQPEKLRTAHLQSLECPALVVQGERDPFGGKGEVETFGLARAIRVHWVGDGDHDLGPRGGSGYTRKGNLAAAADAVAEFLRAL
jgi:predicted alpha/beta-hydrolase family hydrolase